MPLTAFCLGESVDGIRPAQFLPWHQMHHEAQGVMTSWRQAFYGTGGIRHQSVVADASRPLSLKWQELFMTRSREPRAEVG